jgi:mannose-6-phosphate isomerase-like protein (cupin superfamily)
MPTQRIETLASGGRLRWHITAEDTGGALARVELWMPPGGGLSEPHAHDHVEERFELLAGTMAIRHGDLLLELGRGGLATLPAGIEHRWWNAGAGELHLMAELEPARPAPLRCLLGEQQALTTKERT